MKLSEPVKHISLKSKRTYMSKKAQEDDSASRTMGVGDSAIVGDEGSEYPLPTFHGNISELSEEAKGWLDVLIELNKHEEKFLAKKFSGAFKSLGSVCDDLDGAVGKEGGEDILSEGKKDPNAMPSIRKQYEEDPSVFEEVEKHSECLDDVEAKVISAKEKIKKLGISRKHDTFYLENHAVIGSLFQITEDKMLSKGFDKKAISNGSIKKIGSSSSYIKEYSDEYAITSLKTYIELDYINKYGKNNGRRLLKRDLSDFIKVFGNDSKTFDEVFKMSKEYSGPINKKSYMSPREEFLFKESFSKNKHLLKNAGCGRWEPQWSCDARDWVADTASDAYDATADVVTDAWNATTELADDAGEVLSDAYDITMEGLSEAWDGISMGACQLWEWLKKKSAAVWAFLTGGVIAILKVILKFGAKILPILGLLFSIGAICDGLYYAKKTMDEDIKPLADKVGIKLSGMKIFHYNDTATELDLRFERHSSSYKTQKDLVKYAKGVRDLQHDVYGIAINTIQAILDIIFLWLEIAGIITLGVVTALVIATDIIASMMLVGLETGLKAKIHKAYKTVFDKAHAVAMFSFSNAAMSSGVQDSGSPLIEYMSEAEMKEQEDAVAENVDTSLLDQLARSRGVDLEDTKEAPSLQVGNMMPEPSQKAAERIKDPVSEISKTASDLSIMWA